MRKVNFFFIFLSFLSSSIVLHATDNKVDTLQSKKLEQIVVSSTRASKNTPVTYSNMGKKEISKRNLGQDIPFLMNYLPSVVTTSDAGAGVGYTSIRVRGSDNKRINITINGIPYNDSESQGSFWVNLPDFASSVQSLQLQRGVGTSTNGASAFGATLNMQTDLLNSKPFAEFSNSYGSFNTRKHTLKMSTGLINERVEVSGRISQITSDGYIDRASTKLSSYFLQGVYSHNNTLLKALVFGGREKTYQAWNGIDSAALADNRTYNSAGEYTDDNGEIKYYDNETDNYNQKHHQLHWTQAWNKNWSSHVALHYTRGLGYYENLKNDKYSDYGLIALPNNKEGEESKSGIIRRKWLDNHFWGTVFSTTYTTRKLNLVLGGGINQYEGKHYGTILWTKTPRAFEYKNRYYDNDAKKRDMNIYAKANYQIAQHWSIFADMQYRYVNYVVSKTYFDTDDVFSFFNPKAGITYTLNEQNNFYFSYAKSHREPNRDDYENNGTQKPRPEQLNDFELGWRLDKSNIKLNTNLYYMLYKDQLVLTGKLDDVGAHIRSNSGNSYRLGIELDAQVQLSKRWQIRPNITLSQNKNINYFVEEKKEVKSLGNTNISYSPNIVAGNILTYSPVKDLYLSLLSKYVGKQYMSNTDEKAAMLAAYFVNDFNVNYAIYTDKILKSVQFSLLVNNIFNTKYVSNGWYGWGDVAYYPQAGTNFLAAMTLKF